MATFACSARGLHEEVALPRQVRDEVTVDATPYVRPLLAVLDGYRRACIAVVDKAAARFWELYQDQMNETGEIRDRRRNQPNDAAEHHEELRIPDKADELTRRHYRNVADRLRELFQPGRFDLLIIGGQDFARAACSPSRSAHPLRPPPRSRRTGRWSRRSRCRLPAILRARVVHAARRD